MEKVVESGLFKKHLLKRKLQSIMFKLTLNKISDVEISQDGRGQHEGPLEDEDLVAELGRARSSTPWQNYKKSLPRGSSSQDPWPGPSND